MAEFVKRNKIVDQKETYRISENISVKLARDIKKLLDIDVSEYANEIDSDSIIHINKRHGITGKSDHSMGDLSEIEHIEYILENYEDIEIGQGSTKYKNTDNSRAKTVMLTARIDNQDIYVVEAVPDTRRKALKVVSEYKKETVPQVNHSRNTLHRTSKNELVFTASNNSISQNYENDNGNILNEGKGTNDTDIRYQERNYIHLEDGTRVTKKKFLSIMNGRNYKGTRTDKKLWSIKKRLDSEYFQKYNREKNVKPGEHLFVVLSGWEFKCIVYNETDYKTVDAWNYDEEGINNDTERIKNSDYDKVEAAQRSGGRMGANRAFDKDGRAGRTGTGLSGRGTDGNTHESGGNRDFENGAGLRGDRVLKQEGNIEPDQLFSLRNVDETDLYQATYELIEENNELQKQNELLKKQFEVTKGHKPKIEDVEKLGRKLLKEYSSKYPLQDFVDNFKNIIDLTSERKFVNYEATMDGMMMVAKAIVNQSENVDMDYYNQYAELRKSLRSTRIMLTEEQKQEAANKYGSYNDFRKNLFGKVRLVNSDGVQLDSLWQEYSEMYPELFNKDVSDANQINELLDAIEDIKEPKIIKGSEMDINMAAVDLAQKMFSEYFALPSVHTFADARIHELQEARKEFNDNLNQARKVYNEKYEKKVYMERRGCCTNIS